MLYWTLIILCVALSAGLMIIDFTKPGARRIVSLSHPDTRRKPATVVPSRFRGWPVKALAEARRFLSTPAAEVHWQRGFINLVLCTAPIFAALLSIGFYHVYFDRSDLPDIEAFARFEFPTIGTVYDANEQPLVELAKEYRKITRYEDIPAIVRDAIIAAEDKRFFSHNGVDYSVIPRVLGKVRIWTLGAHLLGLGRQDEAESPALLPQGGSTITQQLVRGHFLKSLTAKENSHQLVYTGILPRALVYRDRRAERQHVGAQAGGDSAVVVDRRRDAATFRFETPREGRNSRPLRQLHLHGKRPVRHGHGSGILFWPAARHFHRR